MTKVAQKNCHVSSLLEICQRTFKNKVNESFDSCECDSGEVCVVESKCGKWVMELERPQRRGYEIDQRRLQNL